MAKKKTKKRIVYPIKDSTFTVGDREFLYCGTDLETDMVTVKNIESGNKKDINFYELQALLENED